MMANLISGLGARNNVAVALILFIGLLSSAPAQAQSPAPDSKIQPKIPRVRMERMAACQRMLVVSSERSPHSALMTYIRKGDITWHNMLLKILPAVVKDGKTISSAQAENLEVEDIPGGVTARFSLGGAQIRTEIIPLQPKLENDAWEGASLYRIWTEPPTPVILRLCEGTSLTQLRGPSPALNEDIWRPYHQAGPGGGPAISLPGGSPSCAVALRTDGTVMVQDHAAKEKLVSVSLPSGSGYLLAAFADDPVRAAKLASLNPEQARQQVVDAYAKLLGNQIQTPDRNLNQAFGAAIRTLEYTWIAPIGWNETIHHWLELWHMQHTAGAEWLGQEDRSRSCTLTHGQRLLPDGAVPQLRPDGDTHRDFGGSNQFWAWQARHYLQFTGDKDFARQVAPALDRVLAQTYNEYDRDHNRLLAWSQQIGNQEDMIATPRDGTTPTIEGINMMRTRAEMARLLGDAKTEALWNGRADRDGALLRDTLWQSDLGRYAFFVDAHGIKRPDGQYHTYLYPILFGLLDPLDGYTSLRHVRDRLTEDGGVIYCSNNFPSHINGTWGMQSGTAQQPWAAWALSAAGLRNEAWRPLKSVADWVMGPNYRGSWIETRDEQIPAYFSPPAGLFVASVVEALYGLRVNKPEGYIEISPAFPDSWPQAGLGLERFRVAYSRAAGCLKYDLVTSDSIARRLACRLPPGKVTRVLVNGKKTAFEVQPGVEQILLLVTTPAQRKTQFHVDYKPYRYSVEYQASVAEGDPLTIRVKGPLRIESVVDRERVLADWQVSDASALSGTVRKGQLAPYLEFGRLGQLNFSRRTLFLLCRHSSGTRFWIPVDVILLPRHEAAPIGNIVQNSKDGSLNARFKLRNNTQTPLSGPAWLSLAGRDFPLTLNVPARGERDLEVTMPNQAAEDFSPGDNPAQIILCSDKDNLRFSLVASNLFKAAMPKVETSERIVALPLPNEAMASDNDWQAWRDFGGFPHAPWARAFPAMQSLQGRKELTFDGLPGVRFTIADRKLIPVSWKMGRPFFRLPLNKKAYKKFYLLLVPYIDNHESFVKVARLSVRGVEGGAEPGLWSKDLVMPGDLDWFVSAKQMGPLWSTAGQGRPDRLGLLPLLLPSEGDWPQGRPPLFPQPAFWSRSLMMDCGSSVLDLIELDLGRAETLDSLTFESLGTEPAFGLVALSADRGPINKE